MLTHNICWQVSIWWGDSPCSRVQMSKRSATLEDPSSSAWARVHSYAPLSKCRVQTESGANTPHAAVAGRGCITGSELKWVSCWIFIFRQDYVDRLSVYLFFYFSCRVCAKREAEGLSALRLISFWTATQHVSAVRWLLHNESRHFANHASRVNLWLHFQKYHFISLTTDTGL